MDAKKFIENNTAPFGAYLLEAQLVLKEYALEALAMQKKEDEQVFRGFLLSIIPRLMAGERIDVEVEFKKAYYETE